MTFHAAFDVWQFNIDITVTISWPTLILLGVIIVVGVYLYITSPNVLAMLH